MDKQSRVHQWSSHEIARNGIDVCFMKDIDPIFGSNAFLHKDFASPAETIVDYQIKNDLTNEEEEDEGYQNILHPMRRAFGLGIQYFYRVDNSIDIDKIVIAYEGEGRDKLPKPATSGAGVYDVEVDVNLDAKAPEVESIYADEER